MPACLDEILSSRLFGVLLASLADDRESNWAGKVLARCGDRTGENCLVLRSCGLVDGAGRLRLAGAFELCRFFSISGRFLKIPYIASVYRMKAGAVVHIQQGSESIDPPPDSS